MSAIQASSAGVKDMADGSLRITFEFDPRHAKEAYSRFGARGTSCAIAALTQAASIQAAQKEAVEEPKQKPGQLCVMACTFCADPDFWRWINSDPEDAHYAAHDEASAKIFILETCGVDSRKELDLYPSSAQIFHTRIRAPFLAWRTSK